MLSWLLRCKIAKCDHRVLLRFELSWPLSHPIPTPVITGCLLITTRAPHWQDGIADMHIAPFGWYAVPESRAIIYQMAILARRPNHPLGILFPLLSCHLSDRSVERPLQTVCEVLCKQNAGLRLLIQCYMASTLA